MAGKKVFTNAGDKLAEFLISLQESQQNDTDLDSTLNIINSVSKNALQEFDSVFKMSKEDILKFFDEQLRIELSNLKLTDGVNDVHFLDMAQELYNSTKYQTIETRAQFEALVQVYSTKLASIIKEVSSMNRSYQIEDRKINTRIAELVYKPLDYFIGGVDDINRVYYRFLDNRLMVSTGTSESNTSVFKEVFRVETEIDPVNAQNMILGDRLLIGGLDDTFEKIEMTKPVTVNGDVILVGGELQGTAVKARYADLAEYYITDELYSPGSLLMVSESSDSEATINNNTRALIGVVSDNPGFILNEIPDDYEDQTITNQLKKCPIVLTGKTPVRTHTLNRNGKIEKGDILFPSPKLNGTSIAIPFKESFDYQMENKINPIGTVLIGSIPKINPDDSEIQLIYSKIN